MFVFGVFVIVMFIIFSISIKKMHNDRSKIENKIELEEHKSKSSEMGKFRNSSKGGFFVLGFFCIRMVVPSVLLISNIKSYNYVNFSWGGCIVSGIFVIVGILGIVYTIREMIRDNRIHYLFENNAFVVKKAEIARFEYFSYPGTDSSDGKRGYVIVAYIGSQKYKSKEIGDWAIGFERRNFDKKYFLKKGIPYGPKDPAFNEEFKKTAEAKLREIDLQIAELREEGERSSMFKKFRLAGKIDKLLIEKNEIYPLSMPYRGHKYYIGDEIDVYVDPDNPKIYIM